jgi:hypothetical protein
MRYILLILMLCFAAACATPSNLPLATENSSVDDEKRLWQRSEDEQKVLAQSGLIYRDEELDDYLNRVVRKLQPPEILEHIPFRIRVIKSPYLNAFAFPNGVIYIHTGILARLDNEAQLAALLGHEMTHCTHRHALKTLKHFKSKSDFLVGVQASLIQFRGIRNLVNQLGSFGSKVAVNGYRRDLENEADWVGLQLMVKAGYDAHEALRLFEHLKMELEVENIQEPFFFGSHPRLQERVENCKRFFKTHSPEEGTGIRGQGIFLTKLHRVVLENAWLDLKAGRFHSAQKGAAKYLKIKPSDARVYHLLGEVFRQRAKADDIPKARAYYKRAISLDPFYSDPHKAIGLIYYKDGEKTLAKQSFGQCLSLSPNRADKAYILGYLRKCNQ